jgi:signal transduction histidine kinase
MPDTLLTPTHKIIGCCDALLSETDGALNEKQRTHVETIRAAAGDKMTADNNFPAGLLSGFNWYEGQLESEEKAARAKHDLGYFVRTPLNTIRTYGYLLLKSADKAGNLNINQRELVEQILSCAEQIQNQLQRL